MTFKASKTKIWGNDGKTLFFATIDSTNAEALRRLKNGDASHGEIIVADVQTAGRGRVGRTWQSLPQNLCLTFIGRFSLTADHLRFVTLVAGKSVFESIEAFLGDKKKNLSLKWPNDVYVGDQKIAGILTELEKLSPSENGIACGIGININSLPKDFHEDLRDDVTSIRMIVGQEISREKFFSLLVERFEANMNLFRHEGATAFVDFINQHSYLEGKTISCDGWIGDFSGIDQDGSLRLKDSEGKIHKIISGEIKIVSTRDDKNAHQKPIEA